MCQEKIEKKMTKQAEWDILNGYKICSACHKHKELIYFSFEYNKYRTTCRKCRNNGIKVIKKPIHFEVSGIMSKVCTKCNLIKSLDEFGIKDIKRKHNRNGHCKSCGSIKRKNRYQKNKEHELKRNRLYKENHIQEHRAYHRMREKERKKTDISYRIKCNLSCRMNDAIKNGCKSNTCVNLLGCSVEFILKYLESKFTEGMSLKKFGPKNHDIHIDHILPCELFDLSLPSHQNICFHYTNLQPLWGIDNTIKCDSLPDGRRARDLSSEEKLSYLRSLGYNL